MAEANGSGVVGLDPLRVMPFRGQPRKQFRGIAQLAASIRAAGQATPIVVTRSDDDRFDAVLVDGERRLRACCRLRKEDPGFLVRAVFDDSLAKDRYLASVAANQCRQLHNPVEIMRQVLAFQDRGMSFREIADVFGWASTSAPAQYASLKRLAKPVLKQLASPKSRSRRAERGRLTLSLALLLTRLPKREQIETLREIQGRGMTLERARGMIHSQIREAGGVVGAREGRRKFGALSAAVERCSAAVDRYMAMPGPEIKAMIRGAPPEEKKQLAELMESLCESLLGLSDALTGESK